MLVALILTGNISGAHLNPAVTVADASQGGLPWREVPGYLIAQIVGAFAGVAAAHLMFGEPIFSASRHARVGGAQLFSEFIATFGLLSVIWGCSRLRSSAVPICRGRFHHRGLMVHLVNVLREPRRHGSPVRPAIPSPESAPTTCPGLSWRNWPESCRRHASVSLVGSPVRS